MTARYTNDEWAGLIGETEKALAAEERADGGATWRTYPLPKLGPELARYVDHTLLKLDATGAQIDGICAEARRERFAVSWSLIV